MPVVTIQIGPKGPIADIAVAVSAPRQSALAKAGIPAPPPVAVRGLIDTGASCTCVDPSVIKQLGIPPTGKCHMFTPSSGAAPVTMNLFDVTLIIFMEQGQAHVADLLLPVAEAELDHNGCQVLIGRDVLSNGAFFYDGKSGRVVLTF